MKKGYMNHGMCLHIATYRRLLLRLHRQGRTFTSWINEQMTAELKGDFHARNEEANQVVSKAREEAAGRT